MSTPLITQIYQENYPSASRGRMFSSSVMIRIAVAVIFSDFAGRALSGRLEQYQYLMLCYFLAAAFASYCLFQCQTSPLEHHKAKNPLRGLSYLKTDNLFRNTLICWMLMGFANLMMLPLRVEYLANSKYGLNLSISEIAFLTSVMPNIVRFFLSPVWGILFDKANFFMLRIILNLGFAIGISTFFLSDTFTGLIIGAVIFGISNAGGDIAWSLWVTKFAPSNRVAVYMSIHSFFTGIRGIFAPFAAFYFVQYYSLSSLGFFCTGLIVLASLMLLPEFIAEKKRRADYPPPAPMQ